MKRLQIIDSTTITLFSNLILQGGRNPKRGKKKGGIKVHTVIHASEGVPSDIRFTSAATHDSFMLCPCTLAQGAIIAMDRAYIDYAKFEQMTRRGIVYVTKMKSGLNYEVLKDEMIQTTEGLMQVCIQDVVLTKKNKAGELIEHRAKIVTYPDVNQEESDQSPDQ